MFRLRFCNEVNGRLIKNVSLRIVRQESTKPEVVKPPLGSTNPSVVPPTTRNIGAHMVKPTDFQKKIMVWVKKYPSLDKIPDRISTDALSQSMTRGRIKACNYMILISILGFISAAIVGKRQISKGYDLEDVMLGRNK